MMTKDKFKTKDKRQKTKDKRQKGKPRKNSEVIRAKKIMIPPKM